MSGKKVSIPLIHEMDEKPPEIERDESLPEGTLFLHLIDQKEGRYRLFSRHSNGEMKYTGNFDDLESAQAYANLLDLSKN
jgi:hypothetical protein